MRPNEDRGANAVSRVCVLLLEDSDLDAELLMAELERADGEFLVTRVTNRADFVDALQSRDCEIILADYSLPDFDGLTALSLARELKPEIPFIFVSGVVGEDFATGALKLGAADYVMKRNLGRLDGAVSRALEQARDRAERRRVEEALQRSELSARVATEAAALGLWNYDAVRREFRCDARCRSLFGLDAEAEPSYEMLLDRCAPEDRERVRKAVEAASEGCGEPNCSFDVEFRVSPARGEPRWVAMHGQTQNDGDGAVRLVGVVRDTTAERKAHETLQNLAASLEQQVAERTAERDRIWRLSPDLFAVVGFDGCLRRVNPAWMSMLGHRPDDLVGARIGRMIHPDDQERSVAIVDRLGRGDRIERFENRIRRIDGTWRWIAWTAAPEGDAFYAVGRDITSERAAAEALAERNRQLAEQIAERERVEETLRQMQRLEAVGQLTSGVAHDFNNLLTVILGNVAFVEKALAKLPRDPRLAQRLGHMRTAAERGAKLTAQLLAFSRRQKLEPKPLDLNETVAGMRDLLQSTMGGSIRIETVLKPDLWPALVDPTQIELIILNLAINARDAMEVGGALTVETANVRLDTPPARPEEPSPGDYVMLSVSDTGSGMAPEVLAKAFEPFFTTKDVGKGSGLGLAQVYGFAKQSSGGVRIETRLGEGTTVQVFLPRAYVAAPARDIPPPIAPGPTPDTGGRTVLLLDDDSAVREVTSAMLEELGYAVLEAGSGNAALDLLRQGRVADLLLVDYAMPGMNGSEVADAARLMHPDLPVLFITGYADLKALRDVGEDRIIRKPFRDDELARKLGAILQGTPDRKVIRLRN
ncbi:response regulator [Prosthecomicrobium sp. N25]|uniref:response regulator n=1 Tax=Prosthecomicrobium sp. N25 TaxID=3129254 RepID=UPI003076F279